MLCSVSHSVMKWVNVLDNSQYLCIFSSREQSATLSSSLNALERSQGVLENKLGSMQDQHHQDASKLKVQLAQAESRTRDLQKEVQSTRKFFLWDTSSYIIIDLTNLYHHWCYKKQQKYPRLSFSLQYDDTQSLLSDLRQRYERTEQEKHSINDELEQCKINLKLLQDKGSNVSHMTSSHHVDLTLIDSTEIALRHFISPRLHYAAVSDRLIDFTSMFCTPQ